MEATLDVWEIAAESATRVGHPAPFPVALVERCLHLFTYAGDVVLDPFMGSGTTAVAARRTGRHFIGYDTEKQYVDSARDRVASLPASELPDLRTLKEMARTLLSKSELDEIEENVRIAPGVTVSARGRTSDGRPQHFEFAGVHTPARPGTARLESIWKCIAKASLLREADPGSGLIVLTSGTVRGGPLSSVTGQGRPISAIVDVTRHDAGERLAAALVSARPVLPR
jgi:site-specific DNA-methyltransferase (adenine-specific)